MKFCKQCRRRIRGCKPLRDYPSGSHVRIQGIRGCPKDRCRLLALGLTPGALAEICSNGGGSCCLRVRGADVVLDENLADTVSVLPLSEDEARTA